MSELQWAETPAERGPFWRRCIQHAVGLGLASGAIELALVLQSLRLSLSFGELLLLGLTSVGLGGLLGGVFGAITGGLISIRLKADTVRPGALSAGLVAAALAAWHLIPASLVLHEQGRTAAAIAFALSPIGVAGVITVHGRYGLMKSERGNPYRFSWLWIASVLSGLTIVIAALAGSNVKYGSSRAITSDTSVLLITVDTLRRDHVSVYAESRAKTPRLESLAKRGVVFDNAITPLPETAPAHGAMLTGRHPVRMGMLSNGDSLSSRIPTVTETLAKEGYATGAFVSSFALDSRTGLDQGFQAYDDDFFPWVRGLAEIRTARLGLRVVMRLGDPLSFRSMLERPGDETFARALGWVRGLGKQPFFLWAHVFEPHSPYEPHDGSVAAVDHSKILAQEPGYSYSAEEIAALQELYADEVEYTDGLVGDFIERLEVAAGDRRLAIIFASDHGEMLGEHDIMFNHHGIWDEAMRVPLIVVPPEAGPYVGTRVAAQVRLMDLASTILSLVRMEPIEDTESADLTKFMDGTLDRDLASLLVGREGMALDRGTLLGYRAAQKDAPRTGQNIKFIMSADAGTQWLFDLTTDPQEQVDISTSQAAAAQALRKQVEKEVGGVRKKKSTIDDDTRERLRALGYIE